jgi:hypothetical protein
MEDTERRHESARVPEDSILSTLYTNSWNCQKITAEQPPSSLEQPLLDQMVQTFPSQYEHASPPLPAQLGSYRKVFGPRQHSSYQPLWTQSTIG